MSAPESPIVMSVIVELRHFQILVMQEGPSVCFATISERGTGYGTRALASIETHEGPAAALHLALDQILHLIGLDQRPTSETRPS